MNSKVETIKKIRLYLLESVKDLSAEQLNEVPPGFNNNIIWNLAHLVAAQQGVCYLRAGQKIKIDEKYFLLYKPGTKPEGYIDESEVEAIKELMLTSLEQLDNDLENNTFTSYPAWQTRYGVELSSIDEALDFLYFHEGLHSGYVTCYKRLVSK